MRHDEKRVRIAVPRMDTFCIKLDALAQRVSVEGETVLSLARDTGASDGPFILEMDRCKGLCMDTVNHQVGCRARILKKSPESKRCTEVKPGNPERTWLLRDGQRSAMARSEWHLGRRSTCLLLETCI